MNLKPCYKLLEKLDDTDFHIIARESNLSELLKPVQQNSKHFAKEIKLLGGRLDEKSELVKKKLPDLAVRLLNNGDPDYFKFFAHQAYILKTELEYILHTNMKQAVEDIRKFNETDYEKLFTSILNTKGQNLNLDTFFLQTKLVDIYYSEEQKATIADLWKKALQYKKIKKEVEKEYKEQNGKRIQAIGTKLREQIKTLKQDLKKSKDDNEQLSRSQNQKNNQIEALKVKIKEKENNIKEKENNINRVLKEKRKLMQENEQLAIKLDDKSIKYFDELKAEWDIKNRDLWNKNKKLENKNLEIERENEELTKYLKSRKQESEKINEKIIKLKNIIERWNECIETYFSHIDEKIICRHIDSILFKQNFMHEYDSKAHAIIDENDSGIFQHEGFVPIQEETMICEEYQDYIAIADDNIEAIGKIKESYLIVSLYSCSLMSGLIPLLCGYGAVDVAMALAAATYGEKPTVLSIKPGFDNINLLHDYISSVNTQSVIIADAFGKMNEGILVPLLRMHGQKKLILVAEGPEDIKYISEYMFNYIQLICFECDTLRSMNDIAYSSTSDLKIDSSINPKGYKIYVELLRSISMNTNYINRRKVLLNLLTSQEYGVSEEEAIFSLIQFEIKWFMTSAQYDEMMDYLRADGNEFSKKLIGKIGKHE